MLAIGAAFGRFEIEACLGAGGMGEVYLALDPRLGRRVALKVVSAREAGTEANARLLREARAAAALEHPNAVVIYEVDEIDGRPYIAMEHLRGRSLRDVVADESVSLATRLAWLEDVARTLAAAHRAGIVHRDVKPENVMVREDGVIKVLDFGIARQRSDDASAPTGVGAVSVDAQTQTAPGTAMGTPAYMAPEQIRGDALDARADQFGWGVTAYELIAGRLPWVGSSGGLAVVASILTEEPRALEAARSEELPAGVAEVVRRALAKAPGDRFPTMNALVEALSAARRGAPGVVSEREPRKRRSWLAPAALAALGVALAIVGLRYAIERPSPGGDASAQVSSPVASASAAPSAAPRFTEPPTTVPEARAAYLAGLQAFRDGAINDAIAGFQRAAKLDDGLAAAHLRLALLQSGYDPISARTTYQRARELRSLLTPFDQELLEAVEPRIMRETQDHAEVARRMEAVVARHPDEPEAHFAFAVEMLELGRNADALASLARTLELDPKFTRVLVMRAGVLAFDGDLVAARAACDEAIALSPGATLAYAIRALIDTQEGRCAELATLARHWKRVSPGDCFAPEYLAMAMASEGSPTATLQEVVAQRWPLLPEAERATAELGDRHRLAALAGDFVLAEAAARDWKQRLAGDSELERAGPMLALARVLVETGRDDEARKVGAEYFAARAAWTQVPGTDEYALGVDARPLMIALLDRAGDPSELTTARRAAWLADWKAKKPASALASHVWLYGHVATVGSEPDARQALAALTSDLRVPPFRPLAFAEPGLGRMYLLVRQLDESVLWYERATRSCNAFTFPFEHTRAWLELGFAREARGDKPGACAAFDVVLGRWGKARPRSVSADEARARRRALGCG